MRIITGTARRIQLTSLDEKTVPLSDRAKSALFAIIQPKIAGSDVLDLYAGSGALGIESLSRGAASCIMIDISKKAIESINQNLIKTRLTEKADVLQMDALDYTKKFEQELFDIIFICPPYDDVKFHAVKRASYMLKKDGILIFEHNKKDTFHQLENIEKIDDRTYGIVQFEIYKNSN